MAAKRLETCSNTLWSGLGSSKQGAQRCLVRSMATEAPLPYAINATNAASLFEPQRNPFIQTATLTTHAFPSMEPISFVSYPSTHLLLPLRKDILHRAVIYEGDKTRQGTASTKWRSEVHGSNRKVRPQKGSGKARLGDKKSPMLRGGGVAFGPKPRDFSTRLPGKIYDVAWRTALSYRYRKGELILLDTLADIVGVHPSSAERYTRDFLSHNGLGHAAGRTLFVTFERRQGLFGALEGEKMGREARALECSDVDVKDLLELGRVVVERKALEWMLTQHQDDLAPNQRLGAWERMMKGGKQAPSEQRVQGLAVSA